MNDNSKSSECSTVLARLYKLEGELQFFATQILSSSLPGTLHNMFANSAVYSAKHSHRIRTAFEADALSEIDAIAWSTRCLLETRLMLHHVMQNEHDAAMEIIEKELTRDDKEIALGFRFSDDDSTANEELQSAIRSLPRIPKIKDLADRTGFLNDYCNYYKFLSKYTHPSMYLLFADPTYVRTSEVVDLMVDRAHEYMLDIYKAIAYVIDNLE
jgi:hypothetical protein